MPFLRVGFVLDKLLGLTDMVLIFDCVDVNVCDFGGILVAFFFFFLSFGRSDARHLCTVGFGICAFWASCLGGFLRVLVHSSLVPFSFRPPSRLPITKMLTFQFFLCTVLNRRPHP
jgi:hypothetical protein